MYKNIYVHKYIRTMMQRYKNIFILKYICTKIVWVFAVSGYGGTQNIPFVDMVFWDFVHKKEGGFKKKSAKMTDATG